LATGLLLPALTMFCWPELWGGGRGERAARDDDHGGGSSGRRDHPMPEQRCADPAHTTKTPQQRHCAVSSTVSQLADPAWLVTQTARPEARHRRCSQRADDGRTDDGRQAKFMVNIYQIGIRGVTALVRTPMRRKGARNSCARAPVRRHGHVTTVISTYSRQGRQTPHQRGGPRGIQGGRAVVYGGRGRNFPGEGRSA
jgi:hypothetical protein